MSTKWRPAARGLWHLNSFPHVGHTAQPILEADVQFWPSKLMQLWTSEMRRKWCSVLFIRPSYVILHVECCVHTISVWCVGVVDCYCAIFSA